MLGLVGSLPFSLVPSALSDPGPRFRSRTARRTCGSCPWLAAQQMQTGASSSATVRSAPPPPPTNRPFCSAATHVGRHLATVARPPVDAAARRDQWCHSSIRRWCMGGEAKQAEDGKSKKEFELNREEKGRMATRLDVPVSCSRSRSYPASDGYYIGQIARLVCATAIMATNNRILQVIA